MKTASLASLFLLLAVPARADGPAVERRLHLAQVEASSYLVNDWNKFQENYLPLYIGDDDPQTAWNDGVEGSPVGQWLRMHVTALPGTTKVRLRLRNGYQKNDKIFAANARVRSATVVLLPSGVKRDIELGDAQGWQEVTVEQPAGPLEAVELRVRAIYEGKKYDDLAVSDAQLFVTSTAAENPAYEKSRLDKIITWKRERLAAARLFKTAAAKALPVAAQYRVTSEDEPEAHRSDRKCRTQACRVAQSLEQLARNPAVKKHEAALDRALALARQEFPGMAPVKAVARIKSPLPAVDGMCRPSLDSCSEEPCYDALPMPLGGQLAFLQTANIGTLADKEVPALNDAATLAACRTQRGARFAWALHGAKRADGTSGPLQALFLFECGLKEGREGKYPASTEQLLVYDAEGRLEVSATSSYAAVYDWRAGETGPMLAGGWQGGMGQRTRVDEAIAIAKRE